MDTPSDDGRCASPSGDGTDAPTLTAMEQRTLALSAAGHGVVDVAAILGLTPDAVRGCLASAIAKLGARSKLEAVLIALRRGIITVP